MATNNMIKGGYSLSTKDLTVDLKNAIPEDKNVRVFQSFHAWK